MSNLPALLIQIKGEVAASNLNEFTLAANKYIEAINTKLETDDDFAQAEQDVKSCEDAEAALEKAKNDALANVSDINALLKAIDQVKDGFRDKRLLLQKSVKTQKESVKARLIQSGTDAVNALQMAINVQLKPVKLNKITPNFNEVIKGKKTFDGCKKAIDEAVKVFTEEAQEQAEDIKHKMEWCKENYDGYGKLFADLQTIIFYDLDAFKEVIANRVENHLRDEAAKAAAAKADQERLEKIAQEKSAILEQPIKQEVVQPEVTTTSYVAPIVEDTLNEVTAAQVDTQPFAPTQEQIIGLLINTYKTDRITAIEWLLALDYDALSNELLS